MLAVLLLLKDWLKDWTGWDGLRHVMLDASSMRRRVVLLSTSPQLVNTRDAIWQIHLLLRTLVLPYSFDSGSVLFFIIIFYVLSRTRLCARILYFLLLHVQLVSCLLFTPRLRSHKSKGPPTSL
ncbi:hypothetical protein BKA80DRAFT_118223 [Phyllosticta citrichinensis]